MNGISNKVSLVEGNIQNIDNENITVAVSTDVPKELDKVEKEDKQSFEEFKALYKDVISMKCKQDFGDCEDQKLWEDAAKELFLQSKNYILDGEEFKSKEDLQEEPKKEKKTENVIVTPQVIKENNENEFDNIKPGDEFINDSGSKIVMLEPTETDEYNFKIINTNTNEEGTGKFSCTFMRDLLKDNHYKKVKSSELNESINNEPKDELNAIEFVSLIDNLKKMDLWDGKDETFKDAVEKYYSILDTQSKLKNEGTILSEEQLKEEDEIEQIQQRIKAINKQLAYIRRRDAVSLSIGSENEKFDLYSERGKLNARLKKLKNKKTESKDNEGSEYDYMLLSRLKSDCEYFLKAGGRNERHLWAGNVDDQIAKMKELWNSLEEKPEWLSMEDIENYEKEMKSNKVEEAYDISYHLAEYDKVLRNDNDTYCVKIENRTTQTETKWLLVDKSYVEKMKELENNYKQEESKLNESKLSDQEIQILRKRMTDIVKQYQKFNSEEDLEKYIDEFMPMWIEMQQNLGTHLTEESIEEKTTLEEGAKEDLGIEPGSDEEAKLNELQDRNFKEEFNAMSKKDKEKYKELIPVNKTRLSSKQCKELAAKYNLDADMLYWVANISDFNLNESKAKYNMHYEEVEDTLTESINIGDKVKILNSNELHNNKQGEVTYIDDDIITVKLDNGRSFNYDKNQVQKIEEGVKEKTTLEEDKFFNLYQSFNNLYGINKMNPNELIEFINDLKKMNRISDKDFNVMNDYANKWQDLINKTGYESNIVNESKEVKTEDQYETERRRGVPPIKRIAEQEVYDNEEWYKEHINDYLDITDFVNKNIYEIASEYNLRDTKAEEACKEIYKLAISLITNK